MAFALAWRRDPRAGSLVTLSWILYFLVLAAIAFNLSSLDRQGITWSYAEPLLGLVQRALFVAWFGWIALVGILLSQGWWHEPLRYNLPSI